MGRTARPTHDATPSSWGNSYTTSVDATRHIALPDGWDHWDLPQEQEQLVIDTLFDLFDEYLGSEKHRNRIVR